jgi:hypothetical protein
MAYGIWIGCTKCVSRSPWGVFPTFTRCQRHAIRSQAARRTIPAVFRSILPPKHTRKKPAKNNRGDPPVGARGSQRLSAIRLRASAGYGDWWGVIMQTSFNRINANGRWKRTRASRRSVGCAGRCEAGIADLSHGSGSGLFPAVRGSGWI